MYYSKGNNLNIHVYPTASVDLIMFIISLFLTSFKYKIHNFIPLFSIGNAKFDEDLV